MVEKKLIKFPLGLCLIPSFSENVNYQSLASKKYHKVIITWCDVIMIWCIILFNYFNTTIDAYEVMRRIMSKKISLSMLEAMKDLKGEAVYILRGDLGHGLEQIWELNKKKYKNCRSLAPLMRMGLIEFVVCPTDMSRYYRVRLTHLGEVKLKEWVK